MGAKKNKSEQEIGEPNISWFDCIPVEWVACHMAMYSLIRERTINPPTILNSVTPPIPEEEFRQRVIEAMTQLVFVCAHMERKQENEGDRIVIDTYFFIRLKKYGLGKISSPEGKAIWGEVWQAITNNSVAAKLIEQTRNNSIRTKKEPYDSWEDPLVRKAQKDFERFAARANRAMRKAGFLFQAMINPSNPLPT